MAAAPNADAYAVARVGIFFPAHNNTPADGNLTGQCVTLLKWVFAEMMASLIPNPFSARGDARYVGQRLVAQGLAVEVPYAQRRAGDVICFEYGLYGHIAWLLENDKLFEENANVGGAARRVLADGTVVYASRIGSLNESWRAGSNPHVCRIIGYHNGGTYMATTIPNADNYYNRYRKAMQYIRGRDMSREEFNKNFVGNTDLRMLEAMLDSTEADAQLDYANWGRVAKNDRWDEQIRLGGEKIQLLENERDTINYPKINAATQGLGLPIDANVDQIAAAIKALKEQADNAGNEEALKMIIRDKDDQIKQLTDNFTKLAKENADLKAQLAQASGDTELLNGFGKFLNAMIARLGLKK